MKALTLWQPWAALVAAGVKTIETRSWGTDYRGPLAIHASAKKVPAGLECGRFVEGELHGERVMWDDTNETSWGALNPRAVLLRYSAVVATCELLDVVPMIDCMDPPPRDGTYIEIAEQQTFLVGVPPTPIDEVPYGDYAPGRYAWLLGDINELRHPIPMRGHRGLWDIATRR